MTKGVLDPKYNKGWPDDYIGMCKAKWVPHQASIKKSKIQLIVEDFFEFVPLIKDLRGLEDGLETPELGKITYIPRRFNCVKSWAYKYAVLEYNCVLSPAFWNLYKTLVYSYCCKENISIPSDGAWGKWN
jgi:hypothetical protein